MFRLILLVLFVAFGFYVVWPSVNGYRIYQALETNEPALLASKIDFPSVRQSMRQPVLNQVNRRIGALMKELGPAAGLAGDQIPSDNIERIIDGALERVVTPDKIAEVYSQGGDINAAIKDAVLAEIDGMGGLASVLKLDQLLARKTKDHQGADNQDASSIGGFKIPDGVAGMLKDKDVSAVVGGLAAKYGLDARRLAGKLFPSRQGSLAETSSGKAPSSYGLGNIKSFGFNGPLAMQVGAARSPKGEVADITAEVAFKNYDWRVIRVIPNLIDRAGTAE